MAKELSPMDTIDNRQRILLAAESLFADKGFAGTSVRDIVHQAEVTAPVLYYYFGSKEELLHTLIDERFEQHMSRISDKLVDAKTLEDVINCWLIAVSEGAFEHQSTPRLVLGAMWGPDIRLIKGLVFDFRQRSMRMLVEALQKVDDTISEPRAHFIFIALSGLVNVFVFPLLRFGVKVDFSEVRMAIVPRILAMVHDDAPIPAGVMEQLNTHLDSEIAALAAPSSEEK